MHNFMYVFNKKLFHFYLELRLRTLEISWTKSDRCISKILIRFGSFLAFFEKNTIWPYLVIFGLFLDVIWLCACAEAYQPCSKCGLVKWKHKPRWRTTQVNKFNKIGRIASLSKSCRKALKI